MHCVTSWKNFTILLVILHHNHLGRPDTSKFGLRSEVSETQSVVSSGPKWGFSINRQHQQKVCPMLAVVLAHLHPVKTSKFWHYLCRLTKSLTNWPTNQSINQPSNNQPTNKSTNKPTKQQNIQPTNQPSNQPINQPTNTPTNQSTNHSTN